jgi:hypothetical protein
MKGKALAAVVGVFLLGLVGGATLDHLYPRHGWGWRAEFGLFDKSPDRKHRHAAARRPFVHILSEELGLTEEQMEAIRPMLDQAREKLYETRLASIARYDQIILDLGTSIRASLDEEQTKKLDQLTQGFRERRARKRQRLRRNLEQLRTLSRSAHPGS